MRPVSEITDPVTLAEFAQRKSPLIINSIETLADTVARLYKIIVLADKNMPIRAYLDLVRQMQANSQPPAAPCAEDEFMMAVAFLELEVSKLGAITYLKGESRDYKETKQSRVQLDTRDGDVLKNVSAGLARVNKSRGTVEMGMIESALNRMAKLIELHNALPQVREILNDLTKGKNDVLKAVRVRGKALTPSDYDKLIRMARQEKLIPMRGRQKPPDNKYELSFDNHAKVREVAEKLGITPRRALNQILDDFWLLRDRQRELAELKVKKKKA